MPLKYKKTIIAKIDRGEVEDILLGFGRALNNYLHTPLPENSTIENFFNAFPEGNRDLNNLAEFYVQSEVKGAGYSGDGRFKIEMHFEPESEIGQIYFSVEDEAECMGGKLVDNVYSTMRTYVQDRKLELIEKSIKNLPRSILDSMEL